VAASLMPVRVRKSPGCGSQSIRACSVAFRRTAGRWRQEHGKVAFTFGDGDRKKRRRFDGHQDIVGSVAFSGRRQATRLGRHGRRGLRVGFDRQGPRREAGRSFPEDMGRLWEDLAGEKCDPGYTAVWALASDPSRSLPFLRQRLRPVVTS